MCRRTKKSNKKYVLTDFLVFCVVSYHCIHDKLKLSGGMISEYTCRTKSDTDSLYFINFIVRFKQEFVLGSSAQTL